MRSWWIVNLLCFAFGLCLGLLSGETPPRANAVQAGPARIGCYNARMQICEPCGRPRDHDRPDGP